MGQADDQDWCAERTCMRVRVMRARLRAYLRVCTCTRLRAYARVLAAGGG